MPWLNGFLSSSVASRLVKLLLWVSLMLSGAMLAMAVNLWSEQAAPFYLKLGFSFFLLLDFFNGPLWRWMAGHELGPQDRQSASKVVRAPGAFLARVCDSLFSPRACNQVFTPTLRDLQDEYFEALHQGRPGKARWVLVRCYWSFWSAVVAQVPVSLTRLIVQLWKISGPGG